MTEVKINLRTARKIRTRQKAIEAARSAFGACDYNTVTIRTLAAMMGMSTGAIASNFDGKEGLWRSAMGTNPPVDSPMTRAAPLMLEALMNPLIHSKATLAIELANSPLDGEAWARHLADTLPKTAAPQPGGEAGVLPPGDAGRSSSS